MNGEDVEIQICLSVPRSTLDFVPAFLEDGFYVGSLDELVARFLRSVADSKAANGAGHSLMSLIQDISEQLDISFEQLLFGRPGNEVDRRQLYALLLGYNRYEIVSNLEQSEFEQNGPEKFAKDLACRLARDLDRSNASAIIEVMTLGNEELSRLMLHWLDIYLAENGKV